MRLSQILAASLAVLMSGAGGAPASTALENCANSTSRPGDTLNHCRVALRDTGLSPATRAQILATIGSALAELGRHGDAVTHYALAIQADGGLLPAYTNSALSNEALGRAEDALSDYAAAIAANPDWVEAWAGRGALLLRFDRPAEAIPDLTEALRLEPSDIGARFNRGVAYLRAKDASAAEQDFSTILAADPKDAGAWLNRGRARAALGAPTAEADMTKALSLSPEWGWGHFIRGQFFEAQGKVDAANTDYLRAFQLGYENSFLVQRMREISG